MAYIGALCILDIVLDGLTFINGDVQICGAEAILGDDDHQVGTAFVELLEPSSASVALTADPVVAIMVEVGLGRQRDDFLEDRAQAIGLNRVEASAHQGVTGGLFYTGNGLRKDRAVSDA